MYQMFSSSAFNQPLENWNVSKVTDMRWMFRDSPFNQPLGIWDVSKVNLMTGMFEYSPFNQNISKWCVTNIKSEPQNFSSNSPLTSENKPKWGTCPED
jgi:surface protein